MGHLGTLRLAVEGGQLADVRYAGWKVVQSTWECLALANQVFFDRGLRKSLMEIGKLKHRPQNMERLIGTISTSPDPDRVLQAGEELALSTRQVLRQFQGLLPARIAVGNRFRQIYPEIKDMIGKLLSACESRDRVAASLGAYYLQFDLTMMIGDTRDGPGHGEFNVYSEFASPYWECRFPNLMELSSGPLDELADQTRLLDERLRSWLCEQSVDLCEFGTLEDLKQSL